MKRHRGGMTALERRQRSKLAKLVSEGVLLRGNIVESRRKCGKPKCRCVEGELHVSKLLYLSIEGKAKTFHIPKDWERRIEEWVGNYKEVRKLLDELSKEQLKRFQRREE